MFDKDGSGASIVTDAAEVPSMLVVDRPSSLLLTPLGGFGVAWEICTDDPR
jgi:hypothetical protein